MELFFVLFFARTNISHKYFIIFTSELLNTTVDFEYDF